MRYKFAAALLAVLLASPALGQSVMSGKVTTSAPTYSTGTAGALSLDTSGNLRVVSSGGGGGGGAVNLTQINSVAVSNTTPGTLDVTCIAGCVAGSGTVSAQATTAAPSYTNNTSAFVSQDLSGNLRVTGSGGTFPVTGTFWQATQPVSGTFWQATQPVSGTFFQATQPVSNAGTFAVQAAQSGAWDVDNSGTFAVQATQAGTWNIGTVTTLPALVAGSASIGSVTLDSGTSLNSKISLATTNTTVVKASAGTLYDITVGNNSANIAYLKVYNATSVTCGSGTPVLRYIVPGATSGGAGSNVVSSVGMSFSTGMSYCLTGAIADADTTAVAANAYLINVTYK